MIISKETRDTGRPKTSQGNRKQEEDLRKAKGPNHQRSKVTKDHQKTGCKLDGTRETRQPKQPTTGRGKDKQMRSKGPPDLRDVDGLGLAKWFQPIHPHLTRPVNPCKSGYKPSPEFRNFRHLERPSQWQTTSSFCLSSLFFGVPKRPLKPCGNERQTAIKPRKRSDSTFCLCGRSNPSFNP